jgi:transcriptional regulator with XRE-family HTH domain
MVALRRTVLCCGALEGMRMAVAELNSFGELLRRWREARRMSQLDLGLEAEVSARHISFIETGRSSPSREMVLTLSNVLDVPLRERNALLYAAGYAPVYRETRLDAPQMAQVRQALALILRQMEPFVAVVFDRRWDLVMVNAAYLRLSRLLSGADHSECAPLEILAEPRPNLLQLLFDPAGWRPLIVNWETVAKATLERVHRETFWDHDPLTRRLLDEILSYPDVPARWRQPDFNAPQEVIIPVELRFGAQTLRLFSTITTLGSPQDITLQELRIESFHAVDEQTEQLIRAVATQC